jgi:3-isopropylmalate/(R)-2-methylmalate dehydratase small subunit
MTEKNELMVAKIEGPAYVLGDSVDTDQIIPAEHLVYSLTKPEERRMFGRYALSAVPTEFQGLPFGNRPFTPPDAFETEYAVIVAGANFGCGSSREHAPFAIREAGCRVVIAESYARIFYRNAVDGGFLIPFEGPKGLNERVKTGDKLHLDISAGLLSNLTTGEEFQLSPLGDVKDILEAGGLFEYARRNIFAESLTE